MRTAEVAMHCIDCGGAGMQMILTEGAGRVHALVQLGELSAGRVVSGTEPTGTRPRPSSEHDSSFVRVG